ncbi:hypothetical protein H3005_17675 [Stenotrophomonas sp. Br8]|uniref:hypothetical protein n=1 Tax=Stenotrophomonas sp. Br8 TaxID=2759658 RepID=UPI00168B32D3|nr:hypothetical protein [Stenotrophomonas sp. Br8]MBD3683689.1 hypothetical protein [Stenotrophomonas sp. Br8]
MLMAPAISDHCLPQATLEVKVYRRLSDAEFRLIQKEGKAFAEARDSQGLVVSPRDEGEGYFEVWADGEPVMMVDNSSMQLVLMATLRRAPLLIPTILVRLSQVKKSTRQLVVLMESRY